MAKIFSLAYIVVILKILLRHPGVLPRLVGGPENALMFLHNIRKKEFAEMKTAVKRVNGYLIFLNREDIGVICPSIAVDGVYEIEETELVKRILKKGQVAVDVGANIGWYTLLCSKIVGENGRVIAFEPEPVNFSLLCKSVDSNGYLNVTLFDKCVSNTVGRVRLWLARNNAGSHSLVRTLGNSSLYVQAVILDDILDDLDLTNIDLLKIDVEGAEADVIEGVWRRVHGLRVKNILMEWNSQAWMNKEVTLVDLFKLYDVYEVVPSPYLLKRRDIGFLRETETTSLFLKLKSYSGSRRFS